MNPSLPVGRNSLVAWPTRVRKRAPIAPFGPFNSPFREHTLFMLSDARASEYFLVEAEVTPRCGELMDIPHAHSFLVHWATNTVRDLSNGVDCSCPLADYYWLARISPTEPNKHHAYTLNETCDALVKYKRFPPWQIQSTVVEVV